MRVANVLVDKELNRLVMGKRKEDGWAWAWAWAWVWTWGTTPVWHRLFGRSPCRLASCMSVFDHFDGERATAASQSDLVLYTNGE